ncbi:endonuclease/exonuclease/phosphatase family protein [Donghicola eburneus]|jgi:endonuclease/exonuclease/phosphatase family metal-dependent hydrolase|uniref:Putative membrane protein n=1 Tax=Donghicola eburneus TaxID=393278 RepID=A0A1M4N5Z6_9RHOB|nr:endonuclease/exonuclease/phosphatase family protein [Donghicola eburneus]SCM69488.1 putative membrane protein [Donghicola eburneus]SFQ47220.1 Metal-dependent hydrolase, endonuclease/exonuclease/phosphatase family [Donghicola eburneus]
MILAIGVILGAIVLLLVLVSASHWLHSEKHPIPPQPENSIRLATYNVHYIKLQEETGQWSIEDWHRRKEPLNTAFRAIGPDIITFQEMESFASENGDEVNLARDYLLERNPEYSYAARGDWTYCPMTQPIFYRTSRFELLDEGSFAFPETYKRMRHTCEIGGYPYFASWVKLRVKATGQTLRVVNMHLDYCNQKNRRKSAELISQHIDPWMADGDHVVLMGDFNSWDGMRPLRVLARRGLNIPQIAGSTFHFNRGLHLFAAIDHMGFSENIRLATTPVVVRQKFLGEYPSDHYPLLSDVYLE